jgi:hypothetical protein
VPFATVDEVKAAVAAALHVEVVDLQSYWDEACAEGVATAEEDFRSILGKRGFTADQWLADWPGLHGWFLDQALYWSLVKAAELSAFDEKWVKMLDHRKDLETARITAADGTAIVPADLVGHGAFKGQPANAFLDDNGDLKKW